MALCSSSNDHIDPVSLKFKSDCDDKSFCANGACIPRTCRRDEYPYGYSTLDTLPPLCSSGSFCPDEGSGCLPLLSLGAPCQLNRDEQCAPSTDILNPGSVLCLRSICTYANVPLGAQCIIDNTTYTIVFNGQHLTSTFVKDNCAQPFLYCGQTSMACEIAKDVGTECRLDQECWTKTCEVGVCILPPETPLEIQTWQIVVTITCIVGALIATILMLTLLHKQRRLNTYREMRGYREEQLRLRQSIIALHSTAASSSYLDKRI